MPRKYSVEELMTDDSFIGFSLGSNRTDIERWEQYINDNPKERETVMEAKKMVVSLNKMLRENRQELDPFQSKEEVSTSGFDTTLYKLPEPGNSGKGRLRYILYAAASVVVLAGLTLIWRSMDTNKQALPQSAGFVYSEMQTAPAEKKVVWLPDSTKVILNAQSKLIVAKDFGQKNRVVNLSGEAFFEVSHNKQKPFIVKMPAYEVRVLGTSFNVKAYPEDATSETSLVKGSIEIVLKNDKNRKFLLKPNEKAVLSNSENEVQNTELHNTRSEKAVKISIKNVTTAPGSEEITETAWTKNRLEIIDNTFEEIKPILERWYSVSIHFNDEEVKTYKYTATFEGESLEQVLNALKLSFKFQYSINNKDVYIGSMYK